MLAELYFIQGLLLAQSFNMIL